MRKYVHFFSIVIVALLLSSCGNSYTANHLDKMISATSTSKELKQHITSIQAIVIEKSESFYWYDITGTLKDSFDELSNKEKHQVFAKIVELMQKNGGDMIDDGEFFCGEEIECYIGRIDLNTSNHAYGVEYYPNHSSDLFWVDDNIVYDDSGIDGKYIDPLADNNETEIIFEPTSVDIQSATGDDWITLNYDEKFSLISDALSNISKAGEVKVSVDADWFVEALDAYWASSPTTERLIDIMAITGVGGGVIE